MQNRHPVDRLADVRAEIKGLEAPFCEAIASFPVAGFHSYGESWLAHMNQTFIALLLG